LSHVGPPFSMSLWEPGKLLDITRDGKAIIYAAAEVKRTLLEHVGTVPHNCGIFVVMATFHVLLWFMIKDILHKPEQTPLAIAYA
jgi:hypothetical protein